MIISQRGKRDTHTGLAKFSSAAEQFSLCNGESSLSLSLKGEQVLPPYATCLSVFTPLVSRLTLSPLLSP